VDHPAGFAFPGRWVAGVGMLAGPIIWLAGILLRLPFHFFFPAQLQAHQAHPSLIDASYACVGFGAIVTAFGIMGLATRVGRTHPVWAAWGGTLVILGLFARALHAGADRFAFTLVASQGVASATSAVASSYGAHNLFATLNPAIMFGWMVLAIGARRSRTLGVARAVALAAMAALMLGVLKGSSWVSVVAVSGLCLALVPAGVETLREAPRPAPGRAAAWISLVVVVAALFYILGGLG
jgi:hypothetical protein